MFETAPRIHLNLLSGSFGFNAILDDLGDFGDSVVDKPTLTSLPTDSLTKNEV